MKSSLWYRLSEKRNETMCWGHVGCDDDDDEIHYDGKYGDDDQMEINLLFRTQ